MWGYKTILKSVLFIFLEMMKKILPLLFTVVVLSWCSFMKSPKVCEPLPPKKVYTAEEKRQLITSLGFKSCDEDLLCKYKDCTQMEDPKNVCKNGREFWHHYLTELKNDDLRLDYGEGIISWEQGWTVFSGVEIKLKVLTWVVEITTEARYSSPQLENCSRNITALQYLIKDNIKEGLLPADTILPPTINQKIIKAGESTTISEKDVIIYSDLEKYGLSGYTYEDFGFKITPLAKENRIAYEIIIPEE